ncbi:MAG TPA: hypothetical protein VEK32_15335 [Thermodesulfobacteriota bacterium]|nr:hypothetical protein [Thermodesulfobacteriota bacterium]
MAFCNPCSLSASQRYSPARPVVEPLVDEWKDLRAAPIPWANGPSYHLPFLIDDEYRGNFIYFKKVEGSTCWIKQQVKIFDVGFTFFLKQEESCFR